MGNNKRISKLSLKNFKNYFEIEDTPDKTVVIIPLSMCLGISFGAVFGLLFDHMLIGTTIGIGLGLIVGAIVYAIKKYK
ncbi:MAG: hypothetical protein PHF63_05335 [Herbinix sp.]|nr:hypothetical protein [Herbinix sp.]